MSMDKPAGEEEDGTPEKIEAEIEATRDDLGDTVAAVTDKADLKKQGKKKVEELKDQASEKVDQLKDQVKGQTDSSAQDRYSGSGGDIGSGPTGDVRQSPELVQSDGLNQVLVAGIAGALVVGFLLGRLTSR